MVFELIIYLSINICKIIMSACADKISSFSGFTNKKCVINLLILKIYFIY